MSPPPDPVFVLRSPESEITCARFLIPAAISSTPHLQVRGSLITADQAGNVSIWDLETRRVSRQIRGHSNGVVALDIVNFNEKVLILTQGREGEVKVWDFE
eukprot:TRINITY_DN3600_c0_g1::TRINITY_DN3600_c0_g1_i1::g.18077::m.18077 TRINITY_DN3600_c0_g1::TRINITY_DN3600_c0_g1_i1::g.18077  ORF type:complete len:101 (-),score=7.59,sp/Q9EQ15/GNB1L_MOUSE/34.34/2e-10,WD40/PF00400.27/1.6,WD40/PF00400.27/0.17 TRINITY_DN3600_c0_g1_i1:206-508(-)